MHKILLTGRTGFVGQWFDQSDQTSFISDLNGADLTKAAEIEQALSSELPENVIHLAAQSFVPFSFSDPLATFDINFYGTLNLLQSLKSAGFKGRFIYISSGDVYGLVDHLPVKESHPLKPRNPYAVSKVSAEALCYQWSQTESFDVIIARPFNHIGPGQSERFAISDFARQIIEIKKGKRKSVLTVGNIDVTRDFTDVRDVVKAYHSLLTFGCNGEIYNICTGKEVSVRSILTRLLQLAEVEADIVVDSSRIRKAEQTRVCGDNSKLYKTTKWKPEIALDTSLKDLLKHWEEKLNG